VNDTASKGEQKRSKVRAPHVTHEDKEFWDATAQGKLLIKRCADCGKPHHYPRALCPYCFSERTRFEEASGNGIIYTYSVQRRGAEEPYAIAYVTLDEGVTMLTNLVDCDFDSLRIGQKVRVRFVDTGQGNALPMFAPE
jgi:uncharacterized OB-fold protein